MRLVRLFPRFAEASKNTSINQNGDEGKELCHKSVWPGNFKRHEYETLHFMDDNHQVEGAGTV